LYLLFIIDNLNGQILSANMVKPLRKTWSSSWMLPFPILFKNFWS